jgi:dTDP-4-dehydrorhamnose reductase
MAVLVTGAKGQLGSELKDLALLYPSQDFLFTDVEELDITNFQAVDAFFKQNVIESVINCAAYTAVDRAENEKGKAYLINAVAPRNLAILSSRYEAKLIQISTDFVFDGKKAQPYVETDKPKPLSVYGKTKLAGEKEIFRYAKSALIIRTAWLYSAYGNNFVKTVQRLAREKSSINIVCDQIGTPTYAKDLASVILKILPLFKENSREIYHFSNEGTASWYDFAVAICEFSGLKSAIIPIETKDYPTPAKRPAFSVLNKAKIKRDFGLSTPYWRDSLKECIGEKQ